MSSVEFGNFPGNDRVLALLEESARVAPLGQNNTLEDLDYALDLQAQAARIQYQHQERIARNERIAQLAEAPGIREYYGPRIAALGHAAVDFVKRGWVSDEQQQ